MRKHFEWTGILLCILVLISLFTAMVPVATAAHDGSAYYAGENGRYSVELSENGICYWYQDGERFAGKYEERDTGFALHLVGRGHAMDTDFDAERLEDGSLRINGGLVQEELFSKSKKPQAIQDIDRLWAARVQKNRSSSGSISLTETTVLDYEGIRVSATGYLPNGNKEGVKLLLENNSGTEVSLRLAALELNGRETEALFFVRIGAHERAREMIELDVALIEATGIEKLESISVSLIVSRNNQADFTSEPVSIPVQDNRSRVPVLIPLERELIRAYHLGATLLGYENNGTSLAMYYRVKNESDSSFNLEMTYMSLNGEESDPYAFSTIPPHSEKICCTNLYSHDYSGIGKVNVLELGMKLCASYTDTFVEFPKVRMEFEPDGQLCGFSSEVNILTDSEFWNENFVQPVGASENDKRPASVFDSTVPGPVIDAGRAIVHVYLLFYDEQENLIAFNSAAGILTCGAVFFGETAPNWNCVLTSFSSIDPSRMPVHYDRYQIIVMADGVKYEVERVGTIQEKNPELAFLFMKDALPDRFFIALARTKDLHEGDPVYAIGFPEPDDPYSPGYESYEGEEIIMQGSILDLNHEDNGFIYIRSDIGTSRNLIGGAMVNSEGLMVGMLSPYGGNEDNLAISCDDIADMLETANMPIAYGDEESPAEGVQE